MPQPTIDLEVIAGPDKGRIFRVLDSGTVLGRSPDCTIQLNDTTVSTQHARIDVAPVPKITDLGSQNKIYHNGVQKDDAILGHGDRIAMGSTVFDVSITNASLLDIDRSARPRERLKKRIALGLVGLLFLVVFFYGLKFYQTKIIRETPLAIEAVRGIAAYPGLASVYLPARGDFSLEPTNNYQPVSETGSFFRTNFYTTRGGGYTSRADLITASILPPDPISANLSYRGRNWSARSPRLGNGKFLKQERTVLGNYYVGWISYENQGMRNPTPSNLVGRRVGMLPGPGIDVALQFDFYFEVWDSLPPSAEIQLFALDQRSKDSRFEDVSLVPRFFNRPVDRRSWESSNQESQHARLTVRVGDDAHSEVWIRQVKVGEVLVIFYARCYHWQLSRLEETIEEILNSQEVTQYTRRKSNEELLADARQLEADADQLIPGLMELKFADMDLYKEKWNYFRAYNRYHRALANMQIADRWRYDEDYQRIFSKAMKIFDYVQDERGYFINTWKAIEAHKQSRNLVEAKKLTAELHEIARLGMDPAEFIYLDEWFIYSHLTREGLELIR